MLAETVVRCALGEVPDCYPSCSINKNMFFFSCWGGYFPVAGDMAQRGDPAEHLSAGRGVFLSCHIAAVTTGAADLMTSSG